MSKRTWLAHGIHFNAEEIGRLGTRRRRRRPLRGLQHGARLGHLPDLRARARRASPVGLGVDGSASNDASNMMEAVRHALMIGRLRYGAAAITHLDVLRWATEGSARCLGARRHRQDRGRARGRSCAVHARRAALFRRPRSARGAGAVRRASRRSGDGRGPLAGGRGRLVDFDLDALDRRASRSGARFRLRRADFASSTSEAPDAAARLLVRLPRLGPTIRARADALQSGSCCFSPRCGPARRMRWRAAARSSPCRR